MNILLTGASGQLGRELRQPLAGLGNVIGLDRVSGQHPSVREFDLSDLGAAETFLNEFQPGLILNAAAYTAVDQAEAEPELATRINADLPGCLGRWAADRDCLVVHYSTDYVFPGLPGREFREDDPTGPLNVYGESKLAGEIALDQSGCRYLTLRTSWVYSSHGHNFLLTMLKLATEREQLSIVDDQVGRPTWARNLARASIEGIAAVSQDLSLAGLYHYSDAGVVSWKGFAERIFAHAAKLGIIDRIPAVEAVTSDHFAQAARRPAWSALDTQRIESRLGIGVAGLDDSITACLEDLLKRED